MIEFRVHRRKEVNCLLVVFSVKKVPPTIDGEFEDLKVIVNTPVQLSCQVTGQPPPTVSWTKYGQPIDHHGNDSRLELLSNGALRIVSASVDDSGLYECFASNPAGNASRLITVSIQGVSTTL